MARARMHLPEAARATKARAFVGGRSGRHYGIVDTEVKADAPNRGVGGLSAI
jgi:hypothetical protein